MTTPITGINPPFKNITEMDENKRPKKTKNKADNIIEIVLLNIMNTPKNIYGQSNIKSLGMPNNYFQKTI
jgi:hypothetical protein